MDNSAVRQKRLGNVLDFLKKRGESQKTIAAKTDTDEVYISNLKSGKIRKIPLEFVSKLEKEYCINPRYISGDSEIMFIPYIEQLKQFEQVVKKWDTVEKSQRKYLHLYMDENFYNFLLEVNTLRMANKEGIISEIEEIRNIAQLYAGESETQEFVLLPRNSFIEILQTTKEEKEMLEEVIDLFEHTGYIEDDGDL